MKDICIIGAGSSGVCAAQALLARGLDFDTSRKSLRHPDFPIPGDLSDCLSHDQALSHLEAHADRFDMRRHVSFWLAGVLAGKVPLPDRAGMDAEIAAHRRSQQRHVDSARHTLEVDYREHARSLQRDLVA